MSPYNILLATETDLPELATICCAAFVDHPLYSWLHPYRKQYYQDYHAWKLRIIRSLFYSCKVKFYYLEIPGNKRDEREIVGYVTLRRFYDLSRPGDKLEMNKVKHARSWRFTILYLYYSFLAHFYKLCGIGKSMDFDADAEFNMLLKNTEAIYPRDVGAYFELLDLSVLPKHQREGYGSLLLKHCMIVAGRESLPIFLESIPGNRRFYERCGFKQPLEDWSYVCWKKEPLIESVGFIWDGMKVNLVDKKMYKVDREEASTDEVVREGGESASGQDTGLKNRKGKPAMRDDNRNSTGYKASNSPTLDNLSKNAESECLGFKKYCQDQREKNAKEKGRLNFDLVDTERNDIYNPLSPVTSWTTATGDWNPLPKSRLPYPPNPRDRNFPTQYATKATESDKEEFLSLAFEDYPRSPGPAAGLRSRKEKGELEAKVDEHGKLLPRAISSPISSTGYIGVAGDFANREGQIKSSGRSRANHQVGLKRPENLDWITPEKLREMNSLGGKCGHIAEWLPLPEDR